MQSVFNDLNFNESRKATQVFLDLAIDSSGHLNPHRGHQAINRNKCPRPFQYNERPVADEPGRVTRQ